MHAKGSDSGVTAVMIQMDNLEPGGRLEADHVTETARERPPHHPGALRNMLRA